MAEVIFSHPLISPLVGDLAISVKPSQVSWEYGLNTAVYPTYGGEVVQILSVYFGDMTVSGMVATVAEAEAIYSWFILYMQGATQGQSGASYNQQPVKFFYPEREWHFEIWPKALPGFRLSQDVVAPTWTLTAAVKEPDATFADQIKDYAATNANLGGLATFGKATADFGTTGDLTNNPFGSPDADPSRKGENITQYLSKFANQYADAFNGFVQSWQNGGYPNLPQFTISGPAKPQKKAPGRKTQKAGKTK